MLTVKLVPLVRGQDPRAEMAAGHRKSAWALDAGGGHLGKMDGQTSLDRFQAYCKWEISAGKTVAARDASERSP